MTPSRTKKKAGKKIFVVTNMQQFVIENINSKIRTDSKETTEEGNKKYEKQKVKKDYNKRTVEKRNTSNSKNKQKHS